MEKRLRICAEAAADLAGYQAANLGGKATDEAQEVARQLTDAIFQFEASCHQYAEADLAEADTSIRRMEQFTSSQEVKMAAGEPFLFMDRGQFTAAQTILDRAGGLLKSGDPGFSGCDNAWMA